MPFGHAALFDVKPKYACKAPGAVIGRCGGFECFWRGLVPSALKIGKRSVLWAEYANVTAAGI